MNCMELPSDFLVGIRSTPYEDGTMKIVLQTACNTRFSKLLLGEKTYLELHNYVEPFARRDHVFHVPLTELTQKLPFTFLTKNAQRRTPYFREIGEDGVSYGEYDPATAEEYDALVEEADARVQICKQEETIVADGVRSVVYDCVNKDGAPIKMFGLFVDPRKASMLIGTPDNAFAAGNCKQTVMGELEAAERDGYRVIAATNADFFDMFGDCMPSGITVKCGKILANGDCPRPFFGTKKDGSAVITSSTLTPGILDELDQAVSGRDILMQNGKGIELGLLEAFGETKHPRTCVGLFPDGTYLLLVVDGRLPHYSNGASLVDLLRIMQQFGACDAINLDGGGSSTMIIRTAEGHKIINDPADLERPTEKLIREIYNSILIVEKTKQ